MQVGFVRKHGNAAKGSQNPFLDQKDQEKTLSMSCDVVCVSHTIRIPQSIARSDAFVDDWKCHGMVGHRIPAV